MTNKQIKILVAVVSVFVLVIIGLLNAPSLVTIETSQGTTIAIADERDGNFKDIGTTKKTKFFFRKLTNIYVSVRNGDKQTITTVELQRFKNRHVRLELADTVTAKKISEGSVTNAIFNGTNGQGIIPGQNTLLNFSTTGANQPVKPAFVSLPFVHKILWYDFNNFLYLSDTGVGQFISGLNVGLSGFGTTLTGSVNVENTNDSGSPIVKDITKSGDLPPVFLSNNNIFTGDRFGSRLRAITSFDTSLRDTNIFTSGTSIFKVSGPILTEEEGDDRGGQEPLTIVEELSYSGKVIRTTNIDDDTAVYSVVKKNGITYVLTAAGLHTIRGVETHKENLFFINPAGMVLYKNQIVLLADDGLWKISEDGTAFQRLYNFNARGVGLENSMSITPDNQLLFGTRPKDSDKTDNSATFITSF